MRLGLPSGGQLTEKTKPISIDVHLAYSCSQTLIHPMYNATDFYRIVLRVCIWLSAMAEFLHCPKVTNFPARLVWSLSLARLAEGALNLSVSQQGVAHHVSLLRISDNCSLVSDDVTNSGL